MVPSCWHFPLPRFTEWTSVLSGYSECHGSRQGLTCRNLWFQYPWGLELIKDRAVLIYQAEKLKKIGVLDRFLWLRKKFYMQGWWEEEESLDQEFLHYCINIVFYTWSSYFMFSIGNLWLIGLKSSSSGLKTFWFVTSSIILSAWPKLKLNSSSTLRFTSLRSISVSMGSPIISLCFLPSILN